MQSQQTVIFSLVLTTVMFLALLFVVINILAIHRKKQSNYIKEIELIKATYEKERLKTQLEIQEQTFNHIALELHDNVGHFLSLAKLHLSTLDCIELVEVKDRVRESSELLTSSLEEIRSLSKSLKTECIKENGLIKTVEDLIKQVERSGKYKVEFEINGETRFLDDQKEVLLFRIIQEAFNNILRHSNAKQISVAMDFNELKLIITVKDNGRGFDVKEVLNNYNPHKYSGIKNMITRSNLINASYEIESANGQGTTIFISTPY